MATPPRTTTVDTWNCNKCGQANPVPKNLTDLLICSNCMPHLKHLIRSHHQDRPSVVPLLRQIANEEERSM